MKRLKGIISIFLLIALMFCSLPKPMSANASPSFATVSASEHVNSSKVQTLHLAGHKS